MKVIYIRMFPETSPMHMKVFNILKKYIEYKHCSQSQAVIDLIINSEKYVNELFQNKKSSSEEEFLNFIKRYEESDKIDLFKDKERIL